MKITKKRDKDILEINVIICATNSSALWEYRNMCYEIGGRNSCRMHLTLTKDIQAALRLAGFLPGGIDIFISDQCIEKIVLKELYKQIPKAHFIIRKEQRYVHILKKGNRQEKLEIIGQNYDNLAKTLETILRQFAVEEQVCVNE